jgi:hypothetical protein
MLRASRPAVAKASAYVKTSARQDGGQAHADPPSLKLRRASPHRPSFAKASVYVKTSTDKSAGKQMHISHRAHRDHRDCFTAKTPTRRRIKLWRAEDAEYFTSLSPVFTCTPNALVPKTLGVELNTHPCGRPSLYLKITPDRTALMTDLLLSLFPVFTCTPKALVPKALGVEPNTDACGRLSPWLKPSSYVKTKTDRIG